ncbi:MAG: 2-C-methyl-D-erythritol 4-phosphate cytidylyltransferase [Clostridia bacterium]|nr:2-C-methyl-D-erythritol 4-phosphate cytidylyltransferase [Clostridia bacterium]
MAYGFSKKHVVSDIKRVYVIIPAIGIGYREDSEENRQLLFEVDGVPVITRTLKSFKTFSDNLFNSGISLKAVVVTPQDFVYKVKSLVKREGFDFVHSVVEGGATHTDSVWKGIEALNELPFPPVDSDVIFIHDGTRCLVDQDLLERCLESATSFEICAAAVDAKGTAKEINIPAPVYETKVEEKKETEDLSKLPPIARLRASALFKPLESIVEEKPAPRIVEEPKVPVVKMSANGNDMKEVQTPQVFRYNKLLQSYLNARRNNIEADDDSSLAEAMHYKVNLIEGSYNNIKVTSFEDISLAEMLLKKIASQDQNN